MSRARYQRQLKVWQGFLAGLSLTSRMALREALNVSAFDAVELELHRVAAKCNEVAS